MSDRPRPSDRLKNVKRDLLKTQDRLDDLGFLLAALDCPGSASRAAKAGDAIEDLRRALDGDAGRLADREAARDRQAATAAAGGVTADAIGDVGVEP